MFVEYFYCFCIILFGLWFTVAKNLFLKIWVDYLAILHIVVYYGLLGLSFVVGFLLSKSTTQHKDLS